MLFYYKFSFLIGTIIALLVGLLVLLKNPKKVINRKFFVVALSGSIWSIGFFMLTISSSLEVSRFWRWFMESGSIFLPAFWLDFVYSFLNERKKYISLIKLSFIAGGIIWILNFIDLFYPGVFTAEMRRVYVFDYYAIAGPGYYLFFIYFSLIVFYSLFVLWKYARNNFGIKSQQIKYIIIAAIFGFAGGGTTFLPTIGLKVQPYGAILFGFYPAIIAYVITRYRFLDIRLVVIRTLTFSFLIATITTIYTTLLFITATFFQEIVGINSNVMVGIMVAILVAIGYRPLLKFIESITDSFLFKKTYNPDELLSKVSTVTSSILNLDNLLKSIAKTLGDAFHFQKVAVVLLKDKDKFEIEYKDGFEEGVAERFAQFPRAAQILNKELQRVGNILVLDEMKTQFENGEFKPIEPKLLYALTENDIAIILPMLVQERLIGVIALGNKKSGDPYNQQDLRILKIISGQSAIAVENATLYDELKNFNVKLEDEVQSKTAELRQANRELRNLDKAKSEFISIASHQLRTPLTVIKGYISMMLEGSFGNLSTEIQENLKKVYKSNERLIGLVENLLDISRIESGRQQYDWKEIQLEDLAKTVVENLTNNAKDKGLALEFHLPKKKLPKITVDEAKLHEVMMNFVDNAIKYTTTGRVDVYVENKPTDMVTFRVKDTGKGITKENKDLLFKKFSRGKDSFKLHTEGVGLGLYVAKMQIDAHGGKIWADSEGDGKGSEFSFSIPLKQPMKVTKKAASQN